MAEGREGGFVVLLRKVRSSDLWKSLRADQKGVFVTLLLLANWKPQKARWKDQWYEVARGELGHTLERIAEEAGASVAVVRSTLAVLMADDSAAGGNGPAVAERYPIPNTGPRTGPRVLTIVNYDRLQSVPDDANTGSREGLAQASHSPRTDLAEREQREPEEPVLLARARAGEGTGSSAWDEMARHFRSRLRDDLWERWFAPLSAEQNGQTLSVFAPNRFHRDFVEDNYREWIQEVAEQFGHRVLVTVVVARERAAGGA
jgi:hypothetical protein